MAFTAPVAADLQARFPAFAAVADATIDIALADAEFMVDDTWINQAEFTNGRLLYAAHILTLDGFGSEAESGATSGFKVMKSGSLTLERFDSQSASGFDVLESTSYGRRFKDALRRNRGGPFVVSAA